MDPSLQITIVGGGPVGSLTACLFSRRGYQVDLYEYRSDIRQTPASRGRTINLSLSERGRLALAEAGIDGRVLQFALPLKGRMIHVADGTLKSVPYDPRSNQCIYTVDRKLLNELLLNETEKQANVKLHFKHKLIDASLESGLLTFHRTDTNTKVEVHSSLTIGADGAFSAIRRCMMHRPHFDYEQKYIEHGYVELAVCPTKDGNFAMAEGYLHLWPRGQYVMVAMPNQDKSWTVTLFLPFITFEQLDCPKKLLDFFDDNFTDAVKLIGRERLIMDFFKSKPSPLVSIKCRPYHVSDRAVLIGDAAHAMVPFYGQGMNAGFEDCLLLDQLLASHSPATALKAYTDIRWNDAHAICDLAMYNFYEISSRVVQPAWKIRRSLDTFLHRLVGSCWLPLYQAVCFTTTPYAECRRQRRLQDRIIHFLGILLTASFLILLWILYTF